MQSCLQESPGRRGPSYMVLAIGSGALFALGSKHHQAPRKAHLWCAVLANFRLSPGCRLCTSYCRTANSAVAHDSLVVQDFLHWFILTPGFIIIAVGTVHLG